MVDVKGARRVNDVSSGRVRFHQPPGVAQRASGIVPANQVSTREIPISDSVQLSPLAGHGGIVPLGGGGPVKMPPVRSGGPAPLPPVRPQAGPPVGGPISVFGGVMTGTLGFPHNIPPTF